MTIKEIVEIYNPTETKFKVMREKQDIYVPNISNLNILSPQTNNIIKKGKSEDLTRVQSPLIFNLF